MPATASRRLKQVLAWGLGLGLLAWLLQRLPWASAWEALQRPSWAVWCGVITTLLVSYGLRGARLQVVMGLGQGDGAAAPRVLGLRLDALRVILMHNAAVNLLPMRAGELSFPWLASAELRMPLARAVACLVWMRVQDLVVLGWLGLMVWPGLPLALRLSGLLGLAAAGGCLTWLSHQAQHAPVAGGRAPWWAKWRHALAEPAHHRPAAWGLTLANWAIKLAAGATLLAAITDAPWLTAWGGALGGELAAVVPVQGPAGFGTYEAGVWAAMAWLSAANDPARDHAITAALCLHACFLVCACVAGLTAWALRPANAAPAARPTPDLSSS